MLSQPSQLNKISSELNLANVATRSEKEPQLNATDSMWVKGPHFFSRHSFYTCSRQLLSLRPRNKYRYKTDIISETEHLIIQTIKEAL